MTERGAIYSRISDDREGLEHGVTQQEKDCLKRATREGVKIPEHRIYRENDRGASSKSKKPRPRYAEMLTAIRAGEITVVYSYSNSRLTRRRMELEELIQLHEATGVQFRTIVSGDDDLSTADGRMIAAIKAAVDAGEAERVSERVSRHTQARAEAGRNHGGQRPYGWQAEDRRKLDPAEAKIIREITKRALAGESLRSISKNLNARGVATVTGADWSISTVRNLLANPRLAGIRVHRGEPIAKGDWKPVITEMQHRQLVRLLSDPTRKSIATNVRKYLLTGLAVCADCRAPVVLRINSEKGRPPRRFYGCKVCGMIRKMDWVDTYVDAVMAEFLRGYEPVPVVASDPEVEAEVERLRERIADTSAAFAESDSMTPAELDAVLRVLRRRLKAAEDRLPSPLTSGLLTGLTGDDPARPWESLSLEQKRRTIDLFFTIELHRGRPGIRVFDPATVQFAPR